jgi:hypothetical protein
MTFEILFIFALVALQIAVFVHVYKKIIHYKKFFPESFNDIQIKEFQITKTILAEPKTFDDYLENLSDGTRVISKIENADTVELMVIPKVTKTKHSHFAQVIKSTNAYLCKNKGASADFSILKDTCDRHLEKEDNEIGNLINVPLYIGLAGTFVGIIIGLWNIDFKTLSASTTATISTESIGQLINGVITAMFASLAGLTFTVINSALVYKPAAYKNDTDKNLYYDFIQRELLPYLNTGVSRSLGTLKDVLEHFVQKFGENMDDYKDSGDKLNENLQLQHLVLEEINELGLTKTASKIGEVFSKLKDSSEDLAKFQEYQKSLNTYVDKSEQVAEEMNSIIQNFKDFNNNLKAISQHTLENQKLQQQFKESLDLHFPTIRDHREVWRSQVDEFNQDVREVYKELHNYFKTSTENIQGFISNNNNFFTGMNEIQNAIQIFVENSAIQKEEFKILSEQIKEMRGDFKNSQKESIETNKQFISAIIELKQILSKIQSPSNK